MFKLVCFVAIFGLALAYPPQKTYRPLKPVAHPTAHVVSSSHGPVVAILKQSSDVHPDGSYQWDYESEDGKSHQESGVVKNVGQKEETLEVQGSYQYTAPDGTPIQVHYVANENGFQAEGAHLPVAPEVPAAILRALDYIAAHPQAEEKVYTKPKVTGNAYNRY